MKTFEFVIKYEEESRWASISVREHPDGKITAWSNAEAIKKVATAALIYQETHVQKTQ